MEFIIYLDTHKQKINKNLTKKNNIVLSYPHSIKYVKVHQYAINFLK